VNQFNSIIWDWNGTLLDDVHISLSSVNHLLKIRNLKPLSLEHYLEVFTFPVQDYYAKIGFDFNIEPFETAAHQFIEIYNEAILDCGLHLDAVAVLGHMQANGMKQYILSAMEQQLLEKTVRQNKIHPFFNAVYGLNHQYATSKVEIGINLIDQNQLQPLRTLLIGDTIHDYEVAQSIGCQCILVAKGHQSRRRLESTGARVIDSLSDLRNGILK
jgi:phosphoglycolate phosphatase